MNYIRRLRTLRKARSRGIITPTEHRRCAIQHIAKAFPGMIYPHILRLSGN